MDKPYTDEQIAAAMMLERLAVPVDERWLRTLRRIVVALVGALLAASASTVILVAVVASKTHGDQVTQEVTDCRNLFGADITEAQKSANDAVGQIMVELVRSILNRPPAGTAFDPSGINAAIAAKDQASAEYGRALDDRNAWVAAGSQLPCPLTS